MCSGYVRSTRISRARRGLRSIALAIVVPPPIGPPRVSSMNCIATRLRIAALAVVAAWLGGSMRVAIAQPSLTRVSPGAVAPGVTTQISLHGSKLDGSLRVWTSFPAQVEFERADAPEKERK